jgi:ATP/maltotriose-dependent transcriptional regulator MalT
MSFFLHESIDPTGDSDFDFGFYGSSVSDGSSKADMHILQDKLRIPATHDFIERPRIDSLLAKSVEQFPATLVAGRAGTGKTALAASFAKRFAAVGWYTVESTDIAWPVFSAYFSSCLPCKSTNGAIYNDAAGTSYADIARFLVKVSSRLYAAGEPRSERSLLVLDDIHHIFDAPWFEDFFQLLLYSLPADTHLLLLCRSKPPGPLWRLRSKQILNVIDERVIAFNTDETEKLFDSLSLPKAGAHEAQRQSFGRVSKLLQLAAT